jgi:hypothetical protein
MHHMHPNVNPFQFRVTSSPCLEKHSLMFSAQHPSNTGIDRFFGRIRQLPVRFTLRLLPFGADLVSKFVVSVEECPTRWIAAMMKHATN